MPSAARLGDQILHSQALPQAKHGWWGGLLKGALVGAAIVAVTAVAIVATVGTGGIGAPFAIGAAAVVIGSALKYAKVGFHEGAQAGARQGTRAGPITVGSRNVNINGKAAALACLSLANCTQHGDRKQVAQGSQTVAINGHRMARVGDGGVCGFFIGEGSPNVFAGAPPASCHGLAVGSEIPQGLENAVDTAGTWGERLEIAGGFLMGGMAGLKMLATRMGALTLAGGLAGGMGGSYLASDYARRHGMSASDQMMFGDFGGLTGAFLGGGAVSKAGGLFGRAPGIEAPVELPVDETSTGTTLRPNMSPEENFPGQQSGNNCAPQSCQQVIRQATGTNYSEAEMEGIAQGTGAYDPASGTRPGGEADILNAGGVPAHTQPGTPENIQAALDNGQGVVSGHRAGDLWEGDPNYTADPNNPIDGGHAVHTTGVVRDADGNVTGYVINDTGTGTAGRVVPADQYEGSLDGGPIAVTNDPIRTPAGSSAEAAPTAGDAAAAPGDVTDRGATPSGGGSSGTGGGAGSAVPTVDGNPVPSGVDPARYETLGRDPAIGGGFRANEADTALRVENQEGVTLERYQPPTPGQKGDWIDPASGRVYDGCSPPKTQFFDQQMGNGNYQKSLVSHADNPNVDHVVVDTSGLNLTPAQEARLNANINSLTPAQQAKIVRVR